MGSKGRQRQLADRVLNASALKVGHQLPGEREWLTFALMRPSMTADEYAALPEVLMAEQVAGMLNTSVVQVRRWAAQGTIPATKVGRGWRFSKSRLERFIQTGMIPPE